MGAHDIQPYGLVRTTLRRDFHNVPGANPAVHVALQRKVLTLNSFYRKAQAQRYPGGGMSTTGALIMATSMVETIAWPRATGRTWE